MPLRRTLRMVLPMRNFQNILREYSRTSEREQLLHFWTVSAIKISFISCIVTALVPESGSWNFDIGKDMTDHCNDWLLLAAHKQEAEDQ